MTIDQVVSVFGEPGSQDGQLRRESRFRYFAPIGMLTAEREGYIGFDIEFDRERVVGWRTIRGNPSYESWHAPPEVKWIGKFYLILFGFLVVSGAIARWAWGVAEGASLVESFNEREIATEKIPGEFRFITHDTTLEQVIERVGEPTLLRTMSVDPRRVKGSRLIEGDGGGPAIGVAEYELPNGAAVVLVSEYPFARENRIRTAYYRKPPKDWEPR